MTHIKDSVFSGMENQRIPSINPMTKGKHS